jgi:hypothetical protein
MDQRHDRGVVVDIAIRDKADLPEPSWLQEHSYTIPNCQRKRRQNKDRPYPCMWHSRYRYRRDWNLRLIFRFHRGGIRCARHSRPSIA